MNIFAKLVRDAVSPMKAEGTAPEAESQEAQHDA